MTEFERLIRDPYAVYARHVLGLEPLPDLSGRPDYRLRGTLYHQAIGAFLQQYGKGFPAKAEEALLSLSRHIFAPHLGNPLVAAFWWPRFEKIASAVATEDRSNIAETHAEVGGALEFEVAGRPFRITGQADRIDILRDGAAFIYDYKTGVPPGPDEVKQGLAPQLMLEAAMVIRGAFQGVGARQVKGLAYVRLSGSDTPLELKSRGPDGDLATWVEEQFAMTRGLVARYLESPLHYLPRHIAKSEDTPLPYDHLSRYREWRLSGRRT